MTNSDATVYDGKNQEYWEKCWAENRTRWDMSNASPMLVQLVRDTFVKNNKFFSQKANKEYIMNPKAIPLGGPSTKALIPGCGTGYDVQLLAERYAESIGCDYAEIGVQRAQAWLNTQPETPGKRSVVLADYFEPNSVLDKSGPYDVIYDYTFLCALLPELHEKFASRTAELLAPHGELITLIWPIILGDGPKPSAPPHPMTIEYMENLLVPKGFRCVDVVPILPPELSHSDRDGTGRYGAFSGFARWAVNK